MRYFFLILGGMIALLFCIVASPANAETEDMVTFANFSFVHHVASSIDHVYFATSRGITRFNKNENRWEQPLTGSTGIDHKDIKRVWVDTFDEKLFVETGLGYFEYDLLFGKWFGRNELPPISNNARHVGPPPVMYPPISFNYSSEGRLFDAAGRYFDYTDVLDDNSGTLWIGTWGNGSLRAGEASGIIELMPFGLLQNRVNAIYQEDSIIFAGGAYFDSYRSGISILNIETGEFSYIESGLDRDFPTCDINSLETDDWFVYVGTNIGLLLYDRELQQVIDRFDESSGLADDNVLCTRLTGDTLFVGTERGLGMLVYQHDSVVVTRLGQFEGLTVYDIEPADSAVWIATSGGAYRLETATGRLQKFQDPTMVLFGSVYDIQVSGRDLWFSADDGLLRLDMHTGETTPFRTIAAMAVPRAIAVNHKVVAVGSDKGLTLIYYADGKANSREFTTDDGLPSNYVFSLLMDGDYLWIGTDQGLTRFWWNNPGRID